MKGVISTGRRSSSRAKQRAARQIERCPQALPFSAIVTSEPWACFAYYECCRIGGNAANGYKAMTAAELIAILKAPLAVLFRASLGFVILLWRLLRLRRLFSAVMRGRRRLFLYRCPFRRAEVFVAAAIAIQTGTVVRHRVAPGETV